MPKLELNKQYTLQEIKDIHGITKKVWDTRREEVLEYLQEFYDYEIIQTGRQKYFICEQIYDENYIPMPRKTKRQEIEHFYKETTRNAIEEQPRNTSLNIARNTAFGPNNVYEHAESTAYRYIRPIISKNYDRTDYQWHRYDEDTMTYEPLTQEQLEFFADMYENHHDQHHGYLSVAFMSLADQVYNKEISKKQMCMTISKMALTAYEKAVQAFVDKYKFRPIAVPLLIEKEKTKSDDFTFE